MNQDVCVCVTYAEYVPESWSGVVKVCLACVDVKADLQTQRANTRFKR